MVSADFLRAVAQLVTAIMWPLIVVTILLYFGPPAKRFLRESREATVGGMGFEATFKRDVESALLYGLSISENPEHPEQLSEDQIEELINEFESYLSAGARDEFTRASLLWVDDNPDNNISERETLESFGVEIDISESTDDAVDKLRSNDYNVILSDMGRPESDRAGYELLERKQELGDKAPFIIYSYPVREEHKVEARRRGAFGSTDDPRELFKMVRRALGGTIGTPTENQ